MGPSPYDAPPMSSFIVSPEMNTHARVSPTAHHSNPQHHMGGHPHHEMMQYQHMPPTHHPQPHQVPNFAGVNYMPMQRHPSIQTTRSESPHAMMGADVFGGPVNAPMLEPPMMVDHSQSHLSAGYEYGAVPEVSHLISTPVLTPPVIRIRGSSRHLAGSCSWTCSSCPSTIPDAWIVRFARDSATQEQPSAIPPRASVVLGLVVGQQQLGRAPCADRTQDE